MPELSTGEGHFLAVKENKAAYSDQGYSDQALNKTPGLGFLIISL